MILVKLGGSVITDKRRPLSFRRAAVARLARALRRIREPVLTVHGGGSFGHYWSVRYGMHTEPRAYGARGVAVVKDSMIELHRRVAGEMLRAGLRPYSVPPSALVSRARPRRAALLEAGEIARAQMHPVTFGDALWAGGGRTYILSGDRIMTMAARALRPRLCVFALDADGVYSDPRTRSVMREMRAGQRAAAGEAGIDVTGGIARKLAESAHIARSGADVFVVNGNRPERIVDAVKARRYDGTLIRGRRVGRGAARPGRRR